MQDIIYESESIKNLATEILYKYKLESTLQKFGDVYILGSYALNVMMWKDLDISIQVEEQNINRIFNLIHSIATLLDPGELKYTKYDYSPSSHGSKGIYIQVKGSHVGPYIWDKLDIILGSKEQISLQIERHKIWKDAITEFNRLPILSIKKEMISNSLYRKEIQSVDIYDAVINDNVDDYDEFKLWCKEKKNIRI